MCAAARSRPPATTPWAVWDYSIRELLGAGRGREARLTMQHALEEGHSADRLLTLLDLADALVNPVTPSGQAPEGLRLRLRLLSNANHPHKIEELAQQMLKCEQAAFVHVYLAWALNQQEAYGPALKHAQQALQDGKSLTPREHSLAWRMVGLALNRLNPENASEAAFEMALEGIQGWSRALILMDLGGLYSRRGDEASAMMAYSEALPLLSQPDDRAQTLNNIGLICLRAGRLIEAEDYFGQAACVKSASQSRALCGQGAVNRVRGEWDRAAALYRQAMRLAGKTGDTDDLRQAGRGLGHTQRLAGQLMTALDTLRGAAHLTAPAHVSGHSWVNVDIAATLAMLPTLDPARVHAALSRTGPLDREEAERAIIVRAELARREGRLDEAREAIAALNLSSLWVREEAHAFGPLFDLLNARPEPLPRPAQLHVSLKVLGLPQAQVNGRRIALPPLETVLLAALLDAGGELTTDELTEVLRDARPRTARLAAQRVSRTARQLRAALGWEASVQALPGRYRLDPAAAWSSDLQRTQRRGLRIESFLAGIGLPWVTEREQELRQQDSDNRIE